ncbi:unnamed protein product [Effrenium voratum]|nr:unnamed protein product [Effrenium voratum]|mmetsp:Transcript_93127/g.221526  ORF Transcript_93127/g.221526 Transcript_93127/m.221526 type:complete len:529 (-) Transcript_93127:395-1981(-)
MYGYRDVSISSERVPILAGSPSEKSFDLPDLSEGGFERCFWLLENRTFRDAEASDFREALETSVKKVNQQYQALLAQPGPAGLCKAWRFSRQARGSFLKLAERAKRTPFNLAASESLRPAVPFLTASGAGEKLQQLAGATKFEGTRRTLSSFARKSYKFVMKPEECIDFMCALARKLPIDIFKGDEAFADIHSIYLDSEDWQLYHKKASQTGDGATLLRLRWYGSSDPDHFYAETKVSKNIFSHQPSCKTRSHFERNSLPEVLKGQHSLRGGDKARFMESFQASVRRQNLKPVMRTASRRICFQAPDDPSLRVTIDLDFEAVCEDKTANWHFQEKPLPLSMFHREAVAYTLAIVEIKIQTEEDPNPPIPDWLQQLVKDHNLSELDISKYLYSVAALCKNQIKFVPEWFHASISIPIDLYSESGEPVAVRIDPRTIIKIENLTLKWFAISTVPFGSVIVSSRRVSQTLHLISLAFSMTFVLYATYLYYQRIQQLSKGIALAPDRRGIGFAAVWMSAFGAVYTFLIDFEE